MRVEPALHVLMISDSCYSGVLLRDGDIALRPDDTQMYLKKMFAGKSRTLMASGGDGHSVFARALLRALNGQAAKTFTSRDMFHESVLREVAGNADQTPKYSSIRNSGDDAGDFVFMRGSGKGEIERVGSAAAVQAPGPGSAAVPAPRPDPAKTGGGSIVAGAILSGLSGPPHKTDGVEVVARQGQALFYAKQYVDALPLLRKAAEAGNAHLQVRLGVAYENGYGLSKDYAEAVKFGIARRRSRVLPRAKPIWASHTGRVPDCRRTRLRR